MGIRIAKRNLNVCLNPYDEQQIQNIATFKNKGLSYAAGRTCYYILKFPVCINATTYYSVKIKGAGYYNGSADVIKPGFSDFLRRDSHYGFDENGNVIEAYSDVAPFGGITKSKAYREYGNFEHLSKNNVSTLMAYELLEYDNLFFKGEPLAVVVALCTEKYPLRMYKLLWPADRNSQDEITYYQLIAEHEGISEDIKKFTTRSCLIQKIAQKYAREIKKFSHAGLYIHSGGWSNIQYNLQANNIVLIDLDSTRQINEKNKKFCTLYAKRDFVSNIYRLLISIYNPDIIMQYDDNNIMQTNYVFHLLYGYFGKVYDRYILKNISENILNFYVKSCFNNIKQIEEKMTTMSDEETREYELKMFEFYSFCLAQIEDLD